LTAHIAVLYIVLGVSVWLFVCHRITFEVSDFSKILFVCCERSSSSLQWQFTSVWTAAHHRICRSTASRSPVPTRCGICVLPTVTYLSYRVSGSTPTAVGRSQLLARWHGTHYRISSGIQRSTQTVLGVYLKRSCSRVTSASSALVVLNVYVLYKSTHSLTHSQKSSSSSSGLHSRWRP